MEEKQKEKKPAKEIIFSRPPFAEELMTDEGKNNFNNLPGWQRHLIKQVMKHGDLKLAAKESGVGRFVEDAVDHKKAESKTMIQSLNDGGITSDYLISHLKECLEAETVKTDKHQNIIHVRDLDLKLKTIELILKIRGDMQPQKPQPRKITSVEELFGEEPEDDR
jgi:hypothetical protein